MRRVLPVLFLSCLTWAGAECVSMPGEVLVQAGRVSRVEWRSSLNPRVPQAVQVRVTLYQGGRVVSERVSPEGYVDDVVLWNFAYQGGRLVRAWGAVQASSRSVPPTPVERLLAYDAKGRLEREETRSAVNGKLETVSEFTCTYSPDGRKVTEITRITAGAQAVPGLVTESVLDGQGRPLTVSLQDSLSGKLTETSRFVYVYAAPGGFSMTHTEVNPFSGQVTLKGTSTFDKWGRLVRVDSPETAQVKTYAYRLDRVGNWVERLETVVTKNPDGTPQKEVTGVVKRTLTYLR